MENSKTDILSKSNGAAHDFKNKIQNTEKSLEKMSMEAGEKAGAMVSTFAHSTADYVETGRDYVKENPVKGVAIAAAAGLVVGSLMTLALRKRQ